MYQIREEKLDYTQMSAELEKILEEFDLNPRCDVFEETLIKMAGISAKPTACQFSPNQSSYGRLTNFDLGISYENAVLFVDYFRNKYQDGDAKLYTEESERIIIKGHKTYFIHLNSHILATKVLPDFKKKLQEIQRNEPHVILSYQVQCGLALTPSYEDVINPLVNYGRKIGLDASKSDYIEETYLKMAGITNAPTACQIEPDIASSRKITNFCLGISIEDAEKFVTYLNTKKPSSARIIEYNTSLKNKGETVLQKISVNNKVLSSLIPEFIAALDERVKKEPDAIEIYRKDANVIKYTTKEIVSRLEDIIQKLISVLPNRTNLCYLDEKNPKPQVPSLMSTIYHAGATGGNENVVAVGAGGLFQPSKLVQYQININAKKDGPSGEVILEEIRPDKNGAATLKLINALVNFQKTISQRLDSKEINKANEELNQAVYFYKYACNSSEERRKFKLDSGSLLKALQTEVLDQQNKKDNPHLYQLKQEVKNSFPYDSLALHAPGMRC